MFMLTKIKLNQLNQQVARSARILLASHQNCGDATGSMVAVYLALRRQYRQVTMFLPAPVPKSLVWLPETDKIVTDANLINLADYDLWLCVDAADQAMTGLGDKFKERPIGLTVVNIDHHLTNPGYGDINLVDYTAPAACAMIYDWFTSVGYVIDQPIATCLLTGILTDTGSFSNPATNGIALQTAADLLIKGASVGRVLGEVVYNKTLAELKLWGRALERLNVNAELEIVSTIITQQDFAELKVSVEAVEGVANFLNDLSGFKAVLVLKEQTDGTIKGSLRTTREDVDVAKLAKLWGGGGHKKAAGFTVSGKLVQTENNWSIVA